MRRLYIILLVIALSLPVSISMSEATQERSSDTLRPSASMSHLKLKGTLFTRSLKPLVVLEDTRNGRATMYEIGDTIEGVLKIAYITRGEVTFASSDGEYKLSLPTGGVWQPQGLQSEDEKWYRIKKEGNTFLVDESTVKGAIQRTADIMRNIKISPYLKDGKKIGIMVTKLTEIGILKEAGVKEGDIVKSINGLNLNSPHQIFTAYKKLRNQKEIEVDIIRKDKPIILTYRIQQ
ncbi:MAG: hypothetical protein HQ572_02945 [Candidatus Omnitrophica bacterium]|nr:hypothetical protein [Candidatus Omnitrophota bacterium]